MSKGAVINMTDRAQYIAGLRELADRLERNPNCPLPLDSTRYPLPIYALDEAEFSTIVKTIGGKKKITEDGQLEIHRSLGGNEGLTLKGKLLKSICEKKVIGTEIKKVRKVTTPAVYEEVEEEVEITEWECPPSILNLTEG